MRIDYHRYMYISKMDAIRRYSYFPHTKGLTIPLYIDYIQINPNASAMRSNKIPISPIEAGKYTRGMLIS